MKEKIICKGWILNCYTPQKCLEATVFDDKWPYMTY